MNLNDRLAEREDQGNRVKMALVGAGQMGATMVVSAESIVGFRAALVADVMIDRVTAAFAKAGVPAEQVVVTDDAKTAEQALRAGNRVATSDWHLAVTLPSVEVVVDATGVPEIGARVAYHAINNHKHIVMLTVETDIVVGRVLKKLADNAGVVYTVSAGDEPGAITELGNYARAMGFTIVAAGKGKNTPYNPDATPDMPEIIETAKKWGANPRLLVEFIEASKTAVEMIAQGNALGLAPDVRGMHGPQCSVQDLGKVFSLKSQGGILDREGVTDFCHGQFGNDTVAPGVFVVVKAADPAIHAGLTGLSHGKGPNGVLYRPYHLTNLETPVSAARAVLLHETTMATTTRPVGEVVTVAKKDLKPGDRLDKMGEYTNRGLGERADVAAKERLLPIGLAPDAIVTQPIKKNDLITLDQVQLDYSKLIVHLRAMQDALYQ
jgi:predicted homoserine dehydrogenase-like protein